MSNIDYTADDKLVYSMSNDIARLSMPEVITSWANEYYKNGCEEEQLNSMFSQLSDKNKVKLVVKNTNFNSWITKLNINLQYKVLGESPTLIRFIENPSIDLRMQAALTIRHQSDETYTDDDKLFTVNADCKDEGFIEGIIIISDKHGSLSNPNRSEDTVESKEIAFKDIENPTDEDKLNAVKRDGMNIQYIEDPTKEMQVEALYQNINSYQFMEKFKYEALKNLDLTRINTKFYCDNEYKKIFQLFMKSIGHNEETIDNIA